jgi:ABC-2 type transport system ATP-binding protein
VHAAIEVRDLSKSFGPVRAVEGLTLTVEQGEILALLGPNGAGKTTTVECVEGYLRPDRGTVRVLGLDPAGQRDALLPALGVMLQAGGAWQAATPRDMVRLFARFYAGGADPDALLEDLALGPVAGRPYRTLSGGERQKLHLALALAGRPSVLVLDEPTAGVDPLARRRVWELVDGLRRDGATVLLTTHLIDEAERLADRVAVIDRGRLLACDRPAALVAGGRLVSVRSPAAIDARALGEALGADVRADGAGRWLVDAGDEAIPAIARWFAEHGHAVTELSATRGSLEDVFLRLTASPSPPDSSPLWSDDSETVRSPVREARAERRGPARLAAQAGMELRLGARNGENLLVALGIPVGLLVFFSLVDVLPTGGVPAVDFLLPRMLTVAVMGSALVALAISTGFERGYLVLKRLGTTPLRRRELVGAKALAVLVTVAVQVVVLLATAVALGWPRAVAPAPAALPVGVLGVALATIAFAGLGLLLAGTLRATLTLAVVNALFVALLLGSGLLFPLDVLPAAARAVAALLPSAALGALLDAALAGRGVPWQTWAVLAAWAVAAPALAAWRFRWE